MKPRAKTMRPRAGQAFVKRFDHKQRLMRMNLELREALETQQDLHTCDKWNHGTVCASWTVIRAMGKREI